jgi:hypothetical protein
VESTKALDATTALEAGRQLTTSDAQDPISGVL